MIQKTVKPAPSSFFHEFQSEEEELLKLSLKESRRTKKRKRILNVVNQRTKYVEQDDKSI